MVLVLKGCYLSGGRMKACESDVSQEERVEEKRKKHKDTKSMKKKEARTGSDFFPLLDS